MNFTAWLESLTDDSQSVIAEKIGMSRRTLQNQIYGTPKMETIVKIAETYGLNPHLALTDLDYINARWLEDLVGDSDAALLAATEDELSQEVLRRMLRGVKTEALTTPIDEMDTPTTVTPLHQPDAPDDETDIDPEPYAANRRKPEPVEGDDEYGPGA